MPLVGVDKLVGRIPVISGGSLQESDGCSLGWMIHLLPFAFLKSPESKKQSKKMKGYIGFLLQFCVISLFHCMLCNHMLMASYG